MEKKIFVCPKCGCHEFINFLSRIDLNLQFQATGGNFAKLFDVQNKRFITVSCKQCGFTEIYREETDSGMNILDFLIGG